MALQAEAVLWVRAAVAGWRDATAPEVRSEDCRRRGLRSDAGVARTPWGGEPRDWAAVSEAAGRHNLEPLLFDLVDRGVVAVPAEVHQAWESQYYRNQIFNHSLFEILAALLAGADTRALPVVVLKGPVSIARRLGDPGLRVMADLDLLCRQVDLADLAEIAKSLGFRTVGENATYHLAFQHPGLGAGLEFHFDLYEALADRAEFREELFSGAERVAVDGVSMPAPSVSAEIVLQLAHLLHHDYRVDLRHWLDFALALAEVGPVAKDLRRLLALTDLEPEYEEAVAIASGLFGFDHGSGSEQVVQAVFSAIEAGLLDLRDDRALLAGARVHPGWWARARYAARLLIPSPRRWRALAVSEDSGVGTALVRHLRRVFARGGSKVERRRRSAVPADSPRARLFQRRAATRSSRSGYRPWSP